MTERLTLVLRWAKDHIAEQDVADTIRKEVQDGVDKQQREFLLRRQLEAVRKELAELDGDAASEEEDYRARVEAADLPEKVREAALREVDKLERTSEQSPEGGWIRTWLDTVLELPWNDPDRGRLRHRRRPRDPGRRPRRAVRREGPDHRVPGRPQAPGRARPRRGRGRRAAAPCWRSSARPGSARPRSASRWPGRWAASSSGSRSVVSGTRPRSAVTAGPTSARCRAGSSAPSRRPGR